MTLKTITHRILPALMALSLLTATPARAAEEVAISELTWKGANSIAYLIKAVVELRLGGKAKIVQADNAVTWAALAKGDGSIDINPDMWMPNHQANWDKYITTGKVEHNAKPYIGAQQIYVPKYTADKLNIRTIADLKSAEVAKHFDTDGNGLGEIYTGQTGWKSTQTWNIKVRSYGLDEWWETKEYDHGIFKSNFDGIYKKQKAAAFYLWAPESMHALYDLTPVEEPARTAGCENIVDSEKHEDWLEKSHSVCASEAPMVWVAYTKTLNDRAPKTAKFLKQLQLDPNIISQFIVRLDNKEDPQDIAESWVENNPTIVDNWLKGII